MHAETANAAGTSSAAFLAFIRNPIRYRLFLLKNLPAAYFSGLRLRHVSEEACSVSVPFKWFTQNPFRSTYFACLSMAAEMSTGVLAMAHAYMRNSKVSMLIVANEARYHKKATSQTLFTCRDGALIREAIERTLATGLPQAITVRSLGHNPQGDLVAEFTFTWSFKAKSQ